MDADRELVERAREGDQEAFADLVRLYQARVFNLIRSQTGSDTDADDLAQEVFVKVFKGLAGFRGDAAFRTWLYSITVNVVRSHYGRRSLFGVFKRVEPGVDDDDDPLDHVVEPSNFEATAIRRDAIDRALGELSADLRMAVTLRDIEGLEYQEIASVLRIPIGTVMSRISRGRMKLRKLLASFVGAAEPTPVQDVQRGVHPC